MFGRRKRRDAQAIEAIREQLATADLNARAVLADAIADMELRLQGVEERARLQVSTEASVEKMQDSVTSTAADVARALQQVVEMCTVVFEQLEADQAERRELTEAINRLSAPRQSALDVPARTIGGTVYASPAAPLDHEISIIERDDDEDDDDDDDVDDVADLVPRVEGVTDASDYVLTVLERLTDVVYQQRDREACP